MEYHLQQTGQEVQDILNQAPTTEQNLQSEIERSTTKDQELEGAIAHEKQRAEGVESGLRTDIDNEVIRAEGAEGNLQTDITNEKNRAEGVEGGLRTDVDAINAKIPIQASSENKLATEGFVNSSVATNTADFKGTYPSLEALETEVHDANANDYAFVISTDEGGNTVYNRYKYVAGEGWQFEYALNNSSFTAAQWAAINSGITALLVAKLAGLPTVAELTQQLNTIIASVATEKARAEGAEAVLRQSISTNAAAIVTEKNRAEGVEGTMTNGLNGEILNRQNADTALQQNINAEALLRDNADDALQAEIDGINAKIPTQASASNKLADKAFVNSSIATNTAEFKGTYNSLAELQQVTSVNANDYGFVISTDSAGNTVYNRYKYVEGTGWVFEYALNNSSFTAAQWGAINSGITAALVAKLNGLPTNEALNAMFATITNLIPSTATSDNKLVDFAQMMAAIISNNATLASQMYVPDNVDIDAKAGNMLQFKDNIFNSLLPTGMGRVHLRRNASLDTEWYGFDGFVEDVTALDSLVGTPDAIYWDRINEIFVGKKSGIYYKEWTADDNYSPARTDCHYICNDIPYIWNGTEFIVDDQAMPNMRNILTQSMLPYTNTIYIIKDDFDLDGETITIPANCVLEFEGGSLRNGTITGTNITLSGNVIISNTHLTGTFANVVFHSSWCKDSVLSNYVEDVLNIPGSILELDSDITLSDYYYNVSHVCIIGNGFTIQNTDRWNNLNGDTIIKNVTIQTSASGEYNAVTSVVLYDNSILGTNSINIILENVTANGNSYIGNFVRYKTPQQDDSNLKLNPINLSVNNCKFKNFNITGLRIVTEVIGSITNSVFEHIGYNAENDTFYSGIAIQLGYDFVDTSNMFKHCHDFIIQNNYIKNIVGSYSDGNDEKELHGILCFGQRISITGNYIESISSSFYSYLDAGADTEAIYIKGSFCNVIGNFIHNGVGSLSDGSINIKSTDYTNNNILNNTVVLEGHNNKGIAFRIAGRKCKVNNNIFIVDMSDSTLVLGTFIYSAGLYYSEICNNSVIGGNRINIFLNIQGSSTNLIINGNTVSCMTFNKTGLSNGCVVSNNVVDEDGNENASFITIPNGLFENNDLTIKNGNYTTRFFSVANSDVRNNTFKISSTTINGMVTGEANFIDNTFIFDNVTITRTQDRKLTPGSTVANKKILNNMVFGYQLDAPLAAIADWGLYASVPTTGISKGFAYFATDKGVAGVGAMIYYTGNSTTPWVYSDGTAVN